MRYYLFSVISMVIGKPVSTWKLETTVEKVEKFLDIHMSDFFDWYISEIIMVCCTKQCLLFRNYLQTLFIAFYRLLKIKGKKNCPYNFFLILPMNKTKFWKSEKPFCYLSPRLSDLSSNIYRWWLPRHRTQKVYLVFFRVKNRISFSKLLFGLIHYINTYFFCF